MSIQPLVENAVRHGVEQRAGSGRVAIRARVKGGDVELRGIRRRHRDRARARLGAARRRGRRDRALERGRPAAGDFGERHALRIDSELGAGTTVVMTVPNLRGEREAIEVAEAV